MITYRLLALLLMVEVVEEVLWLWLLLLGTNFDPYLLFQPARK